MDAPFANWLRGACPLLCKNLLMRADSQSESVGRMEQADHQLVELAVEIFKMLADATRVRIVLALRDGELSVNTLADVVGKSPAAVSQHLAKLRLARLVTTRHEGNRVFYRLANEHAHQLVAGALFQAEHSVEDQPRHHRQTIGEARP
jgi:DNA-binding transcriptional ArsR family regulator